MNFQAVKSMVVNLPEVAAWPLMVEEVLRSPEIPHSVWEWPMLACRALGRDEVTAAPVGAAILCMILSVLYVDDMLDEDPRGAYLKFGYARAANLSYAFQAAAMKMVSQAPLNAGQRTDILDALAKMALVMANGQEIDAQNLSGEDNYWKVTSAKSSASFSTAIRLGAIVAEAAPRLMDQLWQFGLWAGDSIQLCDDIKDAFETPANPDWKMQRNNILFLYALTADHPDRERFREIRTKVEDLELLQEAQQILIRSGAVSYGLYHLTKRSQAGKRLMKEMALLDPAPMQLILNRSIEQIIALLNNLNIPIPAEIELA